MNKKTYLMTIDPTSQNKKPSNKDVSKISNQINSVTGLTSQEIVTYSAPPYSYTFCTATFNGKRLNKNWVSQQSFWLDFDSGISSEKVISQLEKYDIIPNIIYYTFNHTNEHPRFRIIILLDKPIYDKDKAKNIRKALVDGIEGCDINCKDAARMFFGGVRSEELSAAHTDLDSLLFFTSIILVSKDKLKTRKLVKNEYLYNNYNRSTSFSPKNDISLNNAHRLDYLNKLTNQTFDFDLAIEKVKIFSDFVSGIELKYKELLGLTTSLVYVKGGQKLLNNTMEKFNKSLKTAYKDEDFALIKVIKSCNYLPEKLENYSPYPEDHVYSDIIDAVKKPRGEVQIIQPIKKVKLSKAEEILDLEFTKAIESIDNHIYIFSTQTAIGKSTKLINLNETTLAFPTHDLKDEISVKMEVDHLVVPAKPIFENKLANTQIDALYAIGLNEEVYKLISDISDITDGSYSKKDRKVARNYLALIKESNNTSQTVLTTHVRALFNQYTHNTVVFDEDPLNSLFVVDEFDFSDLIQLEQFSIQKKPISQLINLIRAAEPGVVMDTKFFGIDKLDIAELLTSVDLKSKLIPFFNASSFCKDKKNANRIRYQIKREIPKEKKVIIMSATPQIEVYKALYGDRVKIIDIPLSENQGKIIQHSKRGYSRGYLKKNLNFTDLIAQIGERKVITFKKYKSKFPTAIEGVHFGKCEGFDFLKGQNLAIVGTPHKNEHHYLFTAYALGIDLTKVNFELQDLKIDWKGFRFRFNTYDDELLRNIQLSAIEADLVQAIGRARSLRTDAEVIVYSNLPLQICSYICP